MLAALIVIAEGTVFIGFAALDLASWSIERFAIGAGVAIFFMVYGGAQIFAGYALLRLAEWPRGAIVFTQLVQVGLAWNVRDVDPGWLSWALAVPAVTCLVAVLSLRSEPGAEHDEANVRE